MAKTLASRASTLGNTQKTNTAFRKFFKNATTTKQQSNVLFEAYKSEAKGKVLTKNVAREVFRKAKQLGMSYESLRKISKKVLKGESAFSRLSHLNDLDPNTAQKNPQVNKGEIIQDILDKGRENRTKISLDAQKNNRANFLNFKNSEKGLRAAVSSGILAGGKENNAAEVQKNISLQGQLVNHEKSFFEKKEEEAKSMLSKIQEKPTPKKEKIAKEPIIQENQPEELDQEKLQKNTPAIMPIKKEEAISMLDKIQEVSAPQKEDIAKKLPEKSDREQSQKDTQASELTKKEAKSMLNKIQKESSLDNKYEKVDEKNVLQILKNLQREVNEMSSAGQTDSLKYQKMVELLAKNQNGDGLWKPATEMDMAAIESYLREEREKQEEISDDIDDESKSKNVNAGPI